VTAGELAARLAFLLAALSARRLARTPFLPSHRPVARALAFTWACDALRGLGPPLGATRALYVAFPVISAALALEVLGRLPRTRTWAAAGGAWAGIAAVVLVASPPRRDPGLAAAFLALHFVSLGVQALAVAALALRRRAPTVTELVALLLLAGDIAELVGPWLHGAVAEDWELARWQWTVVYLSITAVQARRVRWLRTVRGSWPSARPAGS
jgi:hypothetical protein